MPFRSRKLKRREKFMSDGREEREEQKTRLEEQQRVNREGQVQSDYPNYTDAGAPERPDS